MLWVNRVFSEEFDMVPLVVELIQAEWRCCLPGSGGIEGGRAELPLSSGERRSGDNMDKIRQVNLAKNGNGAVGA